MGHRFLCQHLRFSSHHHMLAYQPSKSSLSRMMLESHLNMNGESQRNIRMKWSLSHQELSWCQMRKLISLHASHHSRSKSTRSTFQSLPGTCSTQLSSRLDSLHQDLVSCYQTQPIWATMRFHQWSQSICLWLVREVPIIQSPLLEQVAMVKSRFLHPILTLAQSQLALPRLFQ